jgi:hypothetical protein
MEDHFIYVKGYPDAIPVSSLEEQQIRSALVGQLALDYISISSSAKRLLVRIADISVLESRSRP